MTLGRYTSFTLCLILLLSFCFGCVPKQIPLNTNSTDYEVTISTVRAFICVYFYEAGKSANQQEFEHISHKRAEAISKLVDDPNSQYQLLGYSYGLLISYYWEVVNLSNEQQSRITEQYADRLTRKILQDSWISNK